jgi:predicted ester cyclase
MSTEENKAIVRRWIEEWFSKHNQSVVDELVGPDFIDHGRPGQQPGPEGVKQGATANDSAFSDMRFAIDDLIAEGDKVVAFGTWTGVHQGELSTAVGTIPATGNRVIVPAAIVFRIADGKLAEQWGIMEEVSLLKQIGAFSTPDQAAA